MSYFHHIISIDPAVGNSAFCPVNHCITVIIQATVHVYPYTVEMEAVMCAATVLHKNNSIHAAIEYPIQN